MRPVSICSAWSILDLTTAGEFCRRFEPYHLQQLQLAFDAVRKKVWARQPSVFFTEAPLNADGTVVAMRGECKRGMALAEHGDWSYHPLLVSLPNTGEVLRLMNRAGDVHSSAGAAGQLEQCIELCRGSPLKLLNPPPPQCTLPHIPSPTHDHPRCSKKTSSLSAASLRAHLPPDHRAEEFKRQRPETGPPVSGLSLLH
jgi:hypothetical protein